MLALDLSTWRTNVGRRGAKEGEESHENLMTEICKKFDVNDAAYP